MCLTGIGILLAQGAQAQPTGKFSGSAKLGSPLMEAPAAQPRPDPGTLFSYGNDIGTTYRFTVVGGTLGTIWGDGIYTSDSVLAVAAVHAGLLQPGEAGIVTVEIIDGLSAYEGVSRNGVTSNAYGPWSSAFRMLGVEPASGGAVVLPDPGNLTAHRGQDGTVLAFEVTGATDGSVWGDGTYTDDSRLAVAAVHAGALQPGQTGIVQVEIMPGQASYEGADRNGVSSGSYGSWYGSYRIVPASTGKTKLSN